MKTCDDEWLLVSLPMSKHEQLFFVCTGKDCKKKGIKKVLNGLSKDVKKRFNKSDTVLVKTKCLDLCKKGPNVIFENTYYSKVDSTKIESILRKSDSED